MTYSRRKILTLLLWLPGLIVTACKKSEAPPIAESRDVSIGLLHDIPEGISDLSVFRIRLLRTGKEISAISLVCSHQDCLLQSKGEKLSCSCHGSLFDSKGEVLRGPAVQPLPWFEISRTPVGEFIVHLGNKVQAGWSLKVE